MFKWSFIKNLTFMNNKIPIIMFTSFSVFVRYLRLVVLTWKLLEMILSIYFYIHNNFYTRTIAFYQYHVKCHSRAVRNSRLGFFSGSKHIRSQYTEWHIYKKQHCNRISAYLFYKDWIQTEWQFVHSLQFQKVLFPS